MRFYPNEWLTHHNKSVTIALSLMQQCKKFQSEKAPHWRVFFRNDLVSNFLVSKSADSATFKRRDRMRIQNFASKRATSFSCGVDVSYFSRVVHSTLIMLDCKRSNDMSRRNTYLVANRMFFCLIISIVAYLNSIPYSRSRFFVSSFAECNFHWFSYLNYKSIEYFPPKTFSPTFLFFFSSIIRFIW